MTDGKNPLINITNNGKSNVDLGKILKAYYDAPEKNKKSTDRILFLDEESPDKEDTLARWKHVEDKSVIWVYGKSALNEGLDETYSIDRIMYHEMGHAIDLDDNYGLRLSTNKNIKNLINAYRPSSYNATSGPTFKRYREGIADALSMVAYKNILDKSTAKIRVPKYENGKNVGYEILGYDEWHKRYYNLATFLENELNI